MKQHGIQDMEERGIGQWSVGQHEGMRMAKENKVRDDNEGGQVARLRQRQRQRWELPGCPWRKRRVNSQQTMT